MLSVEKMNHRGCLRDGDRLVLLSVFEVLAPDPVHEGAGLVPDGDPPDEAQWE